MQVIDRILDYAIPSRAKARSAERQLAQANHFVGRLTAMYEAAQTTAENENHWANAKGLSADAAADPAVRKTIRDRARYEDCNNSLCRGVVDTYVDSVYGTGPTLNVETGIDAANDSIEQRFHEHCEIRDFYEKGRLAYRDDLLVGESGLIKANDDSDPSVPSLDLINFECERNCDPYESYDDPYERDGVRLNAAHRPIAYFILDQHPGDNAGNTGTDDGRWYRAEQIVHFVRRNRPEQVRGVSALCAALPMFANFRRFLFATIAAAETAASISAVLKTNSDQIIGGAVEFYGNNASRAVYGATSEFEHIDIAKRMLMQLPAGWDISQFAAQHPNSTIDMFYRVIVAEIGRSLGMPYNVTAADSSDHNYSSGRLDHQFWQRVTVREQARLSRIWKNDILRDWYREAQRIPGYLHSSCREIPFESLNAEWLWEELGHADPKKNSEAVAIDLGLNTTTLKEVLGKRGKDYRRVLKQREIELALVAAMTPPPAKPSAPSVGAADDRQSQETAT